MIINALCCNVVLMFPPTRIQLRRKRGNEANMVILLPTRLIAMPPATAPIPAPRHGDATNQLNCMWPSGNHVVELWVAGSLNIASAGEE